MTAEEKKGMMLLINCLMSCGLQLDKNDQFARDLWTAAELMGISKLDLLKSVSNLR